MRCLRFPFSAFALLVAVACAPPAGPAITANSLHLPLSGPCPTTPGAGAEFASEVTGLQATITGPGIETPIVAEGTADVSVEVPAGLDRVVALFGLVSGSPAWRGISAPTEVKAGVETPIEILLAKIADLTCTRSTSLEKRVFHTATVLNDGNVLVVGGARELADASAVCAPCFRKEAQASSSASIYNPRTGQFTAVGPLSTPRMFHTATKLADGRVVISGGTRTALFVAVDAALDPFPITPTAPLASVEVYDPRQKNFSPAGDDPNGPRVFAASTTLLTGDAVITGGIPGRGNPRNDLGNALSTTTVCGGDPVSCAPGPPMARPRAGHTAFPIDPEGVFLWGGSVDVANNGFQIEFLAPGAPQFSLLDTCGTTEARNLFFAATAQYSPVRVMAAGGLNRAVDGTFSAVLDAEREGSAVFVFDLGADADDCGPSGTTSGFPGEPKMNLNGARFMASAAALPGNKRAVIAGGFEVPVDFADITFTPVDQIDFYVEDELVVQPIAVGGVSRTLREPRAGLTATAIGDGTILLVGGAGTEGALETAEVFADPETPAGVAP
ncbi:MAG: kelch repeat-containing protein [Deltaproteobacteria bacterium]|nr:kelch repeat-containing protein [Deltaproteobacteria bacterium]